MGNKKTLAVLLLAFVLLMGAAGLLYQRLGQNLAPEQLAVREANRPTEEIRETETQEEAPSKVPAPDFTVYDRDGTEVHLSDFVGKPLVVNFWASWCGPCRMEMGDFHEQFLELGDEIQFLMINMTDGKRETMDTAAAFIAEQGYTFPVFYDTQSNAAMTYGAYALPTTYFIDAQGFAIAQSTGAINGETLLRGIDMIR